jgi:putative transposase
MLKGIKIRLELNNKQTTMAKQHAGVARHAYNWGVDICQKSFENKEKIPSSKDLHKKLNAEVKKENPWYYDSSKCSPQQALRNLETAFKNFHRKQKASGYKLIKKIKKNGVVIKTVLEGLPQFKKRGVRDSFYLEGAIRVNGNKIKVPIFGWLKCSEELPATESIKNVSISRTADDWFISFHYEINVEPPTEKTKGIVGVDLGIKTLATLSDGTIFPSIKPYRRLKRKLKMLQRKASKKYVAGAETQSNNYKKAVADVVKLHQTIANQRKDYTHKLTTYLAKNHSEVVIETLNIKGMSKNHRLASAILDGGFFEFSRQMEYKSEWYGSVLTKVGMFYPSSKTCSCCGHKKEKLLLNERIFNCENCGLSIDRDLNASLNLEKQAVSSTVSACGVANKTEHYVQLPQRNKNKTANDNCATYKFV